MVQSKWISHKPNQPNPVCHITLISFSGVCVSSFSSYPDFFFSFLTHLPFASLHKNHPRHFAVYLASHPRQLQHAYRSTQRQRTSSHPQAQTRSESHLPIVHIRVMLCVRKEISLVFVCGCFTCVSYVTMEAPPTAVFIDIKSLTGLYIKVLLAGMGAAGVYALCGMGVMSPSWRVGTYYVGG